MRREIDWSDLSYKLPFRFLGLSEFGVGGPFAQEGGSTAVLPMAPRDDPR